ncbi:hypothetical protein E2C01_074731 [Portunus trituberculatus]|uniref:Uncharacterized protein n=1 Tax=Portunus trituberculatus TaxID=210409 RepID=A0A5B7I8S8_PORTR|nr:hypothetical protein [Portunus trituberculatus]
MTKLECNTTWGEFHLGHDGARTKPDFTFHLHSQPPTIIETRGGTDQTATQTDSQPASHLTSTITTTTTTTILPS